MQQSRTFAFGDYMTALREGQHVVARRAERSSQQVARLTGVSQAVHPQYESSYRAPGVFRTELLRDQRLTVGRYDSRMIGLNGNASSQRQDYDPSDVAPSGAFMSAFMRYLRNDLNYTSDLQYYMGGHAGRWDYTASPSGNLGSGYPSTSESLRMAMAKDPYLHVMVGAGYYDMATPFANAEYTFNHLGYDKTYGDRVEFKYYQSGHMAYLNQESAKQLKADIENFIHSTEPSGQSHAVKSLTALPPRGIPGECDRGPPSASGSASRARRAARP